MSSSKGTQGVGYGLSRKLSIFPRHPDVRAAPTIRRWPSHMQTPFCVQAGLRSDRVGDCMDFFDLTDKQMHHACCSCHVGAKLTASEAAKRLRHVVLGNLLRRKMTSALSTIRHIFRAA